MLIYVHSGAIIEKIAEAAMEGVIAPSVHPTIRAGFPYRSVLMIGEPPLYVCELGEEREAALSQRRIALRRLWDDLTRIAALAD